MSTFLSDFCFIFLDIPKDFSFMYFCVLSIVNSINSDFIFLIFFSISGSRAWALAFIFFWFFKNFEVDFFVIILFKLLLSLFCSSFSSLSSVFSLFLLDFAIFFISFTFSSINWSISLCCLFISLLRNVSSSSILFVCK